MTYWECIVDLPQETREKSGYARDDPLALLFSLVDKMFDYICLRTKQKLPN